MASFNKVILLGNLTRDPEVRYTPKGTAVTELGMAVNRVYTAENGEKREETTFVDVTLWGRTAEIAGEYLKKGRSVYIEGRLQTRKYTDKDGVVDFFMVVFAQAANGLLLPLVAAFLLWVMNDRALLGRAANGANDQSRVVGVAVFGS